MKRRHQFILSMLCAPAAALLAVDRIQSGQWGGALLWVAMAVVHAWLAYCCAQPTATEQKGESR